MDPKQLLRNVVVLLVVVVVVLVDKGHDEDERVVTVAVAAGGRHRTVQRDAALRRVHGIHAILLAILVKDS